MTADTRLDDCLSTRGRHLFVEECDAVDLVRRFGSPLFVQSEDQLRRNVRRFQDAFARGWPHGPVKVMPAAKANWLTALQRILVQEGCGCDIYSPGELSVALRAGFAPESISVNGFPKDLEHIRRSIQAGARITIDSNEEVDMIEQAVRDLDQVAYVRLRLKAPLPGFIDHTDFFPEAPFPTDLAALVYKGGLSFDEIVAAGRRLREMKNVELVGFHQHNGRHHPSTRYWEEQMRAYAREMGAVSRALGGFQPREIDIGGGFAIPRDPFNAATHYGEPLEIYGLYALSKGLSLLGSGPRYRAMSGLIGAFGYAPNQRMAPTIQAYAEACTRTLCAELPRHGIDPHGVTLQLEPGRAMHGDTGVHLATVRGIKRMATPLRWTIVAVDTTEFWFTGGRYEHHLHAYLFANKTDAPPVEQADIVGRSCYGDRLLPMVRIPDVQVGDILAMLDTGAYQEVSTSNFNAMPRPATVLVRGGEAYVVRQREADDDVFRRDVLPDHLAP